jgi:exocyst complex protein 7
MLFDGADDRTEAEWFPRAVDDICRIAPPLSAGAACAAVQVAMARLEDELCHVLAARTLDLEIEALAGLTSLSMAGDQRNSDATDAAGGDEDGGGFGRARRRRRRRRSIRVVAASCRLLRGRHLQTAASSPSTSCCCTPLGYSTK